MLPLIGHALINQTAIGCWNVVYIDGFSEAADCGNIALVIDVTCTRVIKPKYYYFEFCGSHNALFNAYLVGGTTEQPLGITKNYPKIAHYPSTGQLLFRINPGILP